MIAIVTLLGAYAVFVTELDSHSIWMWAILFVSITFLTVYEHYIKACMYSEEEIFQKHICRLSLDAEENCGENYMLYEDSYSRFVCSRGRWY